jgi:hypothetical protein
MSTSDTPEAAADTPEPAAKAKKAKKAKKSKTPEAAASGRKTLAISIDAHPRARTAIRKIRARTALAAFVIVLILSHRSGVPAQEAVMRALLAGLVGNLAGWACALGVWRQLMLGELRVVENVRRNRRRAQAEAAAAAAAAKAAARAS